MNRWRQGYRLVRTLYVGGLLGALSCAFTTLANDVTIPADPKAKNDVSFYGKRVVGPSHDATNPKPSFIRRVIAPKIGPEPVIQISLAPIATPIEHLNNPNGVQKLTLSQLQPLPNQPYPQTISLNISYPSPVNKELTHHKPEQPLKAPTPLSRNDKLLAKKAQHYFERNRRDSTALWDSVQGYPHTTLWDIGSGIAGTLALEALAMKTTEQTHFELQKLLITLQALPIYNQTLPNREYNTKTGKPSGKLSDTDSNGNGWSALDIGRLLIWLRILQEIHPEFTPDITALLTHWQLDRAIHKGTLYGMKQTHRGQHYRQEGRNGYLQYAVEGFRLFGFDVPLPNLNQHLEIKNIQGYPIRTDKRNVPFLTSDPFILASLEYGLDRKWNQIETIYQLHRDHSNQSRQLFSFAEDAMNKNPWFAYNNLYYYGKPWTSVSPSGKTIENPQVFSNKAAFGFSVLFEDDFSDELYNEVLKQSLLFRSIPTGIYADGGSNGALNINTNSLILVALWFKQRGGVPICLNCQPIPLH